MARSIGPACRQCRREGIKLYLKGTRCDTAKCPMEKQWRNVAPGMHPYRRTKGTEYAKRLREKQKVKRYYGVLEAQFQRVFGLAARSPQNTGVALLTMLERRLDNVVHKMNLAASRKSARQHILHGHFRVNDRSVCQPGFIVRQGDRVSVHPRERSRKLVKAWVDADPNRPVQPWLRVDAGKLEGVVEALPGRDDVQIPVEENLIVEFCSR
ncbi:MAG: 30S ribosomal protein S4 [Phycisphaerae bacterium]